MMNRERLHFFDKPRNVQLVLHALYTSCAILFVLDFIIYRHTEHPLEGLWGFYPVYGFVGCVVLVLIAKWMRTFLIRSEGYYDPKASQKSGAQDQTVENKGAHHVGS